MILAGDIGATKTLLGVFNRTQKRPVASEVKSYPTGQFNGLPAIIEEFFAERGGQPRLDAACFGLAGPVIDQHAELTNVPWTVAAADVRHAFKLPAVELINDLEAMASAIPMLQSDELTSLQRGRPRPDGNSALIAPGTGLGEATIVNLGDGFKPVPSEGGHADFAARTDRELDLVRWLRHKYGRADLERVISGPGLMNIYHFTHGDTPCEAVGMLDTLPDAPAIVSKSGMGGWCPHCVESLDLLVEALGAAAGNLALRVLATAGVYLGGGIVPHIVPALQRGPFMQAFRDKPPMTELLTAVPVQVILNPQTALIGAAIHGNGML